MVMVVVARTSSIGQPPARPGARASRTGAPARPAPRRRLAEALSNRRHDNRRGRVGALRGRHRATTH
eukprot:1938121-Prymnesium_polylepis.2